MKAIRLDKEIACEYLCHQIQSLVNSYRQQNVNLHDCVLIMDIKQSTEGGLVSVKPLLEYQPDLTE